MLNELDAELAASGERTGTTLSWSASEREHREMIAETIDRKVHLQRRYENIDPTDAKNLVRAEHRVTNRPGESGDSLV